MYVQLVKKKGTPVRVRHSGCFVHYMYVRMEVKCHVCEYVYFPQTCVLLMSMQNLSKKKRAPRDIVMQDIDNYDYDEDRQRLIKTEAYNKQEMRQFYWEYNFVY